MQQFEEALKADETSMLSDFTEAPNSPVVGPQQLSLPPQSQRVRKVSALSDFAPVNLKVRKYVVTVYPLLRSAQTLYKGAGSHPDRRIWAMSGFITYYVGPSWYVNTPCV